MATIDIGAVVALLGRELTDDEEVRAVALLDIAEGVIEDALPGFSVATGTEEVDFIAYDPEKIWLPRYPVTTVNSLTVESTVLTADDYRVSEHGRVEWRWPYRGCWQSRLLVEVDYDFGTDPPPYSVVSTAASAVAATIRRQSANTDGLLTKSETVDGYSYQDSYGASQQEALAAGLVVDMTSLKRWQRNRQVSVHLIP